jgi:drug/metabolite transporter (DMT)-like permease
MTGWFPFAVAALLLMGAQRFLYKVAAEQARGTAWTTLWFMATVTVISGAAFMVRGAEISDLRYLLVVSLANSIAFLAATVSHIEALKRLPAGIAYPLIRLDVVLVVVISLLFFHERVSLLQGAGILLGFGAALLIARQRAGVGGSSTSPAGGLLFVAIAILAGTAAAVSSRFAALGTDKTAFIALSYGLSTLFITGFGVGRKKKDAPEGLRGPFLIGFTMGVLNVAGFYAYLEGLARGPLSLVTVITGMHFVVAIALSILIYRERPTPALLVGITLTVISLILLRA